MSVIQQQLLVTGVGQLLGAVIRVRQYGAAELLARHVQAGVQPEHSIFTFELTQQRAPSKSTQVGVHYAQSHRLHIKTITCLSSKVGFLHLSDNPQDMKYKTQDSVCVDVALLRDAECRAALPACLCRLI